MKVGMDPYGTSTSPSPKEKSASDQLGVMPHRRTR